MNFTALVSYLGKDLSAMDSHTIPESSDVMRSEDASPSSSTGGLWTTEEMTTLSPIVTDSLWEQVITAGLLMVFWVFVNVSNLSLFYVIRSDQSLHTPHYMVQGCYMMCDVLYCNLTFSHMVPVVISNNIHVMNATVARGISTLQVSFLLSSIHIMALLAYERYSYFIRPLTYTRKFTKSRIYTIVVIIYVLALCVNVAGNVGSVRIPVSTAMMYQNTGLGSQIINIVYAVVYAIPSCTMSVITLARLRLLISKHKAQLQPIEMSEDQTAVDETGMKPVKKALKMFGLVSGSFWLTSLPGFLIRLSLSASGVTWADTDQRVSLPIFALSRANYLMIAVLSSVLNPIIYISVLTELREAAWKCIGIKRNSSVTLYWDFTVSFSEDFCEFHPHIVIMSVSSVHFLKSRWKKYNYRRKRKNIQ